jgi:hypothetical protein
MVEEDFSPVHRAVFSVLKLTFERNEPISAILLAEKLKSFSITFEDIQPLDYLQALQSPLIMVKQEEVAQIAKEIKKQTVIRELTGKCDQLKEQLKGAQSKPFNEIVGMVDKTLSDIDKSYYVSQTQPLLSGLIDEVENRGNNPVDTDEIGYMGAFPSINQSIGSMTFPGSFVVVGARTGGAKTQFGFFNMLHYLEKYSECVVLWLDTNEMTKKQLQMRAVCAMSGGQIPLWAIYTGRWRNDPDMLCLVRDSIWPRIRKIESRLHYYNIGNMDFSERIPFIRRFYHKYVGRSQYLIISLDYLKGISEVTKYQPEYQLMGAHVDALKGLITDEIPSSLWAYVQLNRIGITRNKTSVKDIDESENSFSISDRIIQQATNAFHMRWKIPEELAEESLGSVSAAFGNIKYSALKGREMLGKDYRKALLPVKLDDGRFVHPYYNLHNENFSWFDRGSLSDMLEKLGRAPVTVYDKTDDDKKDEKVV